MTQRGATMRCRKCGSELSVWGTPCPECGLPYYEALTYQDPSQPREVAIPTGSTQSEHNAEQETVSQSAEPVDVTGAVLSLAEAVVALLEALASIHIM